jgi:D-glycero-beta-D-manno-heptose-7-phosphate kinase
MGQLNTIDELKELRPEWRAAGKTVVWTNGCFDLLHSGHVRSLQAAKQEGDILIVGINSDRSVRKLKGSSRPIVEELDRAELLASLACVDHVVIFDDSTPEKMLATLQPDVHCKGADYQDGKKPMPELETVRSYGGRIAFLKLQEGRSTTGVIERIQALAVMPGRADKGEHSTETQVLNQFITERLASSSVVVVGDIMLDEYVLGAISRISPEAPVPVIDILERKFSCGGAANVAVNIAGLGATSSLIGLVAEDPAGFTLRSKLSETGVMLTGLVVPEDRQTICKSRLVAGQQQIVRVDQENKTPITPRDREKLLDVVADQIANAQVCVLSDYGKGMLSEDFCQRTIAVAQKFGKPVIVDPKGRDFSKYRGCSVITPNLKETSAAAGIEIDSEEDLQRAADALLKVLPGTSLLVTRGPQGMTLFTERTEPLTIPTVARHVYDVVGAGDTAVATLAVAIGGKFPIQTAIHLANIAAGIVVEKHGTVSIELQELLSRSEANQILSEMTEPQTLKVLTHS